MREKIYAVLNKVYAVTMSVAFFSGVLPLIPFIAALIIGGDTATTICVFLSKQYYPWVIALASIAVLIGLVAMYVGRIQALSTKSLGMDKKAEAKK